MAEQGEPFAFCGRIVEAYYTNPELDTVGILWSDGEKNREYYVVVDEDDEQFQALLKEWSYESLDECTRARNESVRQNFRDAFHRYATEQGLYGHGNPDDQIKTVVETQVVEVETEREVEVEKLVEREVEIVQVKKEIQKEKVTFDNLLEFCSEFDVDNDSHKEQLFKLKLKMFEEEKVTKSKSKVKKTALRKAENPLEVLAAYGSF
ncbi:hypothetical protein [uncultured Mediterranean phage]|nr:hypothetical protein [uncultured Mediterranean phage]|tara:strand:- start:104 stop:724 length:621 start_codon:yes stop_codon:yes gene_type:complete